MKPFADFYPKHGFFADIKEVCNEKQVGLVRWHTFAIGRFMDHADCVLFFVLFRCRLYFQCISVSAK